MHSYNLKKSHFNKQQMSNITKTKKTTLFETGRLISYVCAACLLARYNIHFPHIILFISFPYIDFHLPHTFHKFSFFLFPCKKKKLKTAVDDSFVEYLDSHRIYSVSQSVIPSVIYLK